MGHEVVAVEPPSRGGEDLSRTDPARLLDGASPGAVVNAAALSSVGGCRTDPARAFAVNSSWPGKLAGECASRGIPLIHISTDLVYCGGNTPYTEASAAVPLSVYGWSKLLGDRAVLSRFPGALVVRTSVLFGRVGAARPTFSEEILAGTVGELHVDAFRNHTPIHWFGRALLGLVERGARGFVVLASAFSQSRSAFAEALLARTGAGSPPPLARRPRGTPGDLSLDPSRAADRFGIALPDPQSSLEMEYPHPPPG